MVIDYGHYTCSGFLNQEKVSLFPSHNPLHPLINLMKHTFGGGAGDEEFLIGADFVLIRAVFGEVHNFIGIWRGVLVKSHQQSAWSHIDAGDAGG